MAELVKGGNRFQCHIDVATGKATLAIVGSNAPAGFHPIASTAVKGPGKHEILFSNIDDELRLWVNRSRFLAEPLPVTFDAPTTYDSEAVGTHIPTQLSTLEPAGVAANNCKVTVDHVKIMRDIYYIAVKPR